MGPELLNAVQEAAFLMQGFFCGECFLAPSLALAAGPNLTMVPVLRDFLLIPASWQADAKGAACLRARGMRGRLATASNKNH